MGKGDSFNRPYKRQSGEKPTYTPEQTARYKSMWERYQKSLDIAPDAITDDGKYRFLSDRSPVGYWEVRFDLETEQGQELIGTWAGQKCQPQLTAPLPTQTRNLPFPDIRYSPVLIVVISDYKREVVKNTLNGNTSTDVTDTCTITNVDFPVTINNSVGARITIRQTYIGSIDGSPQNYDLTYTYQIAFNTVPSESKVHKESVGSFTQFRLSTPLGFGGLQGNLGRITFDLNSYNYFNPANSTWLPREYISTNFDGYPNRRDIIGRMSGYTFYTNFLPPNYNNTPPPNCSLESEKNQQKTYQLSPQEAGKSWVIIDSSGVIRNNKGYSKTLSPPDGLNNPQLLNIDYSNIGGELNCACPDFSKQIGKFADSIYSSLEIGSNWENSQAGTPSYCKHILATMRYQGEKMPEYTDVSPLLNPENFSQSLPPLVTDGRPRTGSFDFQEWGNAPNRPKKARDIKRRGSSW